MHAWTDGYEISEVNKSKTKKKYRKNRLSTDHTATVRLINETHGPYRRRGSNPGPQAFATRNLRMRLGARTPRFARIYFFGPDIHRETSYIKRLALYQLSYVG